MNIPSTTATSGAVAVILLSFSVNSIITRYLVSDDLVNPIPVTIIRFVSGLVMLQILTSAIPKRLQRGRIWTGGVWGAVFLGAYAFAISFGYGFISVAAGTFVFYSMVVLTMSSYSIVVDREGLSRRFLLGQALGILGIVVITYGGLTSVSVLGVFLMSITGIAWGMYSVYGRKFDNFFGYTYNSFLLFGLANVALISLTFPLMGSRPWMDISPKDFALALYMGMISTALSYVLWNGVLKKLKASQGGLVQLLVPVVTSGLGVLLLSEKVTPALVLGGSLVLAAMYVNGSSRING